VWFWGAAFAGMKLDNAPCMHCPLAVNCSACTAAAVRCNGRAELLPVALPTQHSPSRSFHHRPPRRLPTFSSTKFSPCSSSSVPAYLE
jgi:hypothetical protein